MKFGIDSSSKFLLKFTQYNIGIIKEFWIQIVVFFIGIKVGFPRSVVISL
jgi:hypothetical protein